MVKKYCERDDVAGVTTITLIGLVEKIKEKQDLNKDSIPMDGGTMSVCCKF